MIWIKKVEKKFVSKGCKTWKDVITTNRRFDKKLLLQWHQEANSRDNIILKICQDVGSKIGNMLTKSWRVDSGWWKFCQI